MNEPACRSLSVMAMKPRYTAEEADALSRGLPPATADDVSITLDGVRIDSKEKVLALIAKHAEWVAEEQAAAAR